MRAMPTPSADDGPGFHSNMLVSELTKRGTRAIEVSIVRSAPSVVETVDGVMHETRPTPTEPHEARGLEPLDPKLGDRGSKAGPQRARGRLALNKSQGRKRR
jgi:hypothetical protein